MKQLLEDAYILIQNNITIFLVCILINIVFETYIFTILIMMVRYIMTDALYENGTFFFSKLTTGFVFLYVSMFFDVIGYSLKLYYLIVDVPPEIQEAVIPPSESVILIVGGLRLFALIYIVPRWFFYSTLFISILGGKEDVDINQAFNIVISVIKQDKGQKRPYNRMMNLIMILCILVLLVSYVTKIQFYMVIDTIMMYISMAYCLRYVFNKPPTRKEKVKELNPVISTI